MTENYNNPNNFFAKLAVFTLKWRWLLIVLLLLLTVLSFYKMRALKMITSTESYFVQGDQALADYDRFKEIFGNDDFVYILIETENFFDTETIKLIGKLAEDLEHNVPFVKDVKFLGNVEYVEGVKDGIIVHNLIERIPETDEEMMLVRERAMSEPLYVDSLISRDGKTAAILLECEHYPDDDVDARKTIPPAVYEVLATPEYADLKHYIVGVPVINYEMKKLSKEEGKLFGLACIVVELLILLWVGRGVRGVVAPLVVVISTVFCTFGAIGILGMNLSGMSGILPALLICVCIGDSMHIIAETQDHQRSGLGQRESIVKALALVGTPCLLTSLTTGVGFISFLSAHIKPMQDMGVHAAIGVIMAFLLSVIIVPIFFSFGRDKKKKEEKESIIKTDIFDKMLGNIASLNIRYPKTILGIFIALIVVSIAGYSLVEVETNWVKRLKAKHPTRQAHEYVDSHMGGSMSIEIMLDTGKKDGVKDPGFLQKVEALQNHIDKHPLTRKTTSIIDHLKKMRKAMHENTAEYYSLPETRSQVSQYLFLYETSGGKEMDKLISFNYDIAHINARTESLGTKEIYEYMNYIKSFVKEDINPSIEIKYTGGMGLVRGISEHIKSSQQVSFSMAFVAITIMMILVLRSFKLGLISMIPNVFPVIISLGFIGYSGIPLSIPLMMMSAVIIGVAVDDTIHFFSRYRLEFNRFGKYPDALKATLMNAGRPITFTTMTLVVGFSVYTLSNTYSLIHFGLMAGFAFIWALLADFFLAPAMLLLFKPLGAERQVSMVN